MSELLATTYFGPVVAGVYNLNAEWKADPMGGRSGAAFSGRMPKAQAEQLHELVNNPDAASTTGGTTGVLVPFWSEAPKARAFIGKYLLTDEQHSPEIMGDGFRTVAFSLSAVYLGDAPEFVVPRYSTPKGNIFSLTAKSTVVSPFRPEDDDGDHFLLSPGGTFATREFDPSYPHLTSRLTPGTTANVGFYVGTVTTSTDALDSVAFPAANFGSEVPSWLSEQGNNVRAHDRRAGREVYGPHPFLEPSDILITNGLVRFWVGNKGLPPFLNVQAFSGGSWGETGYVHLADPTGDVVLTGARVERITAEEAVVVLSMQGQGNTTVTLRRGERMFRITHGDGVSASRRVEWAGLPPWERLEVVGQGPGRFGRGFKSENDGGATWADPEATWADPDFTWGGEYGSEPDFRLRWPLANTGWTLAWWYTADQAVADGESGGQWTITDDIGGSPVRIWFDTATSRFKAAIGAVTLQSSVQTFAAGDKILLALSLSSAGIVFTVGTEHVTDPSTADGTTGSYSGLLPGIGTVPYGTGPYGVGPYGGRTLPDGVVSDVGIWRRALATAELDALAAATARFEALPEPEGDLVWYASFDPRPILRGSAFASGRRYEATTEGGTTRSADSAGLTKALAVLTAGAAVADGLVLAETADQFEIAAYLATTDSQDDLADHHSQFAAESRQEVKVR